MREFEGFWDRTKRKFKENPLIPIGLMGCVYGMYRMTVGLNARDTKQFQTGQRIRVGAQFLTSLFFMAGVFWTKRSTAANKELEANSEENEKEGWETRLENLRPRSR
jgi:hypothetical protein